MKPQTKLFTANAVDNLRNAAGNIDISVGHLLKRSSFTLTVAPGNALELVAHELSDETLPTWRRFVDAPPPDGFYWSRYADEPREWSIIVEVEGNNIIFHGDDVVVEMQNVSSLRQYYTQPILPPP